MLQRKFDSYRPTARKEWFAMGGVSIVFPFVALSAEFFGKLLERRGLPPLVDVHLDEPSEVG